MTCFRVATAVLKVQGGMAYLAIVFVLFESMGEIFVLFLPVMTPKPECCYNIIFCPDARFHTCLDAV